MKADERIKLRERFCPAATITAFGLFTPNNAETLRQIILKTTNGGFA
jgi:hypothetical protein